MKELMRMRETAGIVDWWAIKSALAPIPHADDAATIRLKSRDFYWFSPVLRESLDG